MFNKQNTTVVIQGPVYEYTPEFIEAYLIYGIENIIFSTWENENTDCCQVPVIKSKLPTHTGTGNINLQVISSVNGIKKAETDYIIKVRSDILIRDIDKWLEFCSEHYKKERIFVLGLSYLYPFSPRDQIFIGVKDTLLNMFDIPLKDEDWKMPSIYDTLYPEVCLGLNHHRKYDGIAQKCWENYNYIHSIEVKEHWNKIKGNYMFPVSKNMIYDWPKHFPNGYDYNNKSHGEFWFEDIQELTTKGLQ